MVTLYTSPSCTSCRKARALRHDVQLGEVYNVTIRYVLLQYDTLALIRVLLYMIY